MGFQAPVSANVTIEGETINSYPYPSSSQTIINIYGAGTGSNQTAYTVTVGKVFYLLGCCFNTGSGSSYVKSNADTVLLQFQHGAGNLNAGITSSVAVAVYTSGQNVRVLTGNTNTFALWGFEQ